MWPAIFCIPIDTYFLLVKNLNTIYLFLKVLEEKEEKIAPGTLLGTTHT